MKKLSLALLLACVVAAGQTQTTYTATNGAMSRANVLTMWFSPGMLSSDTATAAPLLTGYWPNNGGTFSGDYFSYSLPDGTSAHLTNFSGTTTALGNNQYMLNGIASGYDDTNSSVSISTTITFSVSCRAGRGGGCTKKFGSGGLTLNR